MADEFDSITSLEDIIRILKIAEASSAEVYCQFSGLNLSVISVELEIRAVSGTNVVLGIKKKPGEGGKLLSTVFVDGIKVGDPIEVVFSLVDGQYAIRDIISDVSMATLTLSAGRNLLRLQRRKDFRVSVKTDGLTFVTKMTATSPETSLKLLDLSAGGLRLVWPQSAGAVPAMGTALKGTLQLAAKDAATGHPRDGAPEEKNVAVEIKFVKDHGLHSPTSSELGQALSFQFQNLGQEEARAVLFTCLFIHRSSYESR